LARNGDVIAEFMHRRVREVPPTGGPSSVAESWADETLAQHGRRILNHLNWTGAAMVEFKRDLVSGVYYLIEINPKFWGSLGLAIAAGVDFPYLAFQIAAGHFDRSPGTYQLVRYQWLSMDIAHSLAVRRPYLWLAEVLRGTPNDFRWRDPAPSVVLAARGVVDVVSGTRRIRARMPPSASEPN